MVDCTNSEFAELDKSLSDLVRNGNIDLIEVDVSDVLDQPSYGYATVGKSGEKSVHDLIEELMDCVGIERRKQSAPPMVTGVISNNPATVVFFDDGTKTVTKCREGDEYDPLLGILLCVTRKLTRNRGNGVDAFEPMLADVAGETDTIADLESQYMMWTIFANVMGTTLDAAKRLDEVADLIDPQDIDKSECDDGDDDLPEGAVKLSPEQLSQYIRNLMADGEM